MSALARNAVHEKKIAIKFFLVVIYIYIFVNVYNSKELRIN